MRFISAIAVIGCFSLVVASLLEVTSEQELMSIESLSSSRRHSSHRSTHNPEGSDHEPVLNCQLAAAQSLKALVSLASIGITIHIINSYEVLCQSARDLPAVLMVIVFALGIAEILFNIIEVCTSCEDRIHESETADDDLRQKMRVTIKVLGGIGIGLGVVKTGGVMHYLTDREVIPICDDHHSPADFLNIPVFPQILIPSLLQVTFTIVSMGLATCLDQ